MFRVVIINPHKVLYEGLAHSISLPGEYGEFEVMSFHCPIMSTLKAGEIILKQSATTPERAFQIKQGIVRMSQENELVALVDG